MTHGLYADMDTLAWGGIDGPVLTTFSEVMPFGADDWQMLMEILSGVVQALEAAVFILRDWNSYCLPNLAKFAADVWGAIDEGKPLQGPVALVLEGWDQPTFKVDTKWSSIDADPMVPVQPLPPLPLRSPA